MTGNNSIVAIFKSHIEAETPVKELQQSGFDMKKLPSSAATITRMKTSSVTITPKTA